MSSARTPIGQDPHRNIVHGIGIANRLAGCRDAKLLIGAFGDPERESSRVPVTLRAVVAGQVAPVGLYTDTTRSTRRRAYRRRSRDRAQPTRSGVTIRSASRRRRALGPSSRPAGWLPRRCRPTRPAPVRSGGRRKPNGAGPAAASAGSPGRRGGSASPAARRADRPLATVGPAGRRRGTDGPGSTGSTTGTSHADPRGRSTLSPAGSDQCRTGWPAPSGQPSCRSAGRPAGSSNDG